MDYSDDPAARRAEWFRYYSEKRITHQWFQVHLLQDLPEVRSVLEVGPGLGLVSAMLHNAGFSVTTLDRLPPQYAHPETEYLQAELADVEPGALSGFDCILCCETLEHLYWDDVDGILSKFRDSGVPWLVISVPYQGFQGEFRAYFNGHTARQMMSLKSLKFLKKFTFDAESDPYGHKWEVGYRGHGLKALESKLTGAGFRIHRRDFTSPTRSVFFVLQNPG
ncbi:MAG: hypothetical protein CL569_17850 [Alphaproteobacteria bacterium]|nr:hypothetical protein [Alphaproteobacteria bacterium]|tara:strand:+ start:200 stop:865 length:666 start_codon:yes stop_codon:yes gene_type:complete